MTTRSNILPDVPENFTIEKTLAGELLKLNFKDRAEIEEDIHGVRGGENETDELLEEKLARFDEELNVQRENGAGKGLLRNIIRINGLDKAGAEKAKSDCYLNDPEVRLRFLRCEQFDLKKAYTRFENFLYFTSLLYGDFVADRPISLSDFTAKEQLTLQNSRVQYLPFRDRSGRRILVNVGSCNFELDATLRFKIAMFLHWVVSEDIETQQKGIVFVAWVYDEDEERSWKNAIRPKMKSNLKHYHKMHFDALPIRLASFQHFSPDDTVFFRSMCTLYFFHMPANIRKFFRGHFGNEVELLYKLSSFGVPVDLLPVSSTRKVKTANQFAWVSVQRAKLKMGDSKSDEEIVECPRSSDVVFKKGPSYRNNPGNQLFRKLIEQYGDLHQKGDKEEKYQITLRIVEAIEEINGRFLEWSKPRKMWLRMKDRNKVRFKVASSIKQYNRQRTQQMQQLKSSIQTAATIDETPARGVLKRELSSQSLGCCVPKRPKNMDVAETKKASDAADDFCFGLRFIPT